MHKSSTEQCVEVTTVLKLKFGQNVFTSLFDLGLGYVIDSQGSYNDILFSNGFIFKDVHDVELQGQYWEINDKITSDIDLYVMIEKAAQRLAETHEISNSNIFVA